MSKTQKDMLLFSQHKVQSLIKKLGLQYYWVHMWWSNCLYQFESFDRI